MVATESQTERAERIIKELKNKYPNKAVYDLDGKGTHFVCEIEPVSEHAEYDKAIEVIISSKPHKHSKMTQRYTIVSGDLELHVENQKIQLKTGDKYTVKPNNIHWAKSDDECWVEIYSRPGWTKEDHVLVKEKP
jgi:mannose-6-phosphate isomerase-like protein (cupin superfamily)